MSARFLWVVERPLNGLGSDDLGTEVSDLSSVGGEERRGGVAIRRAPTGHWVLSQSKGTKKPLGLQYPSVLVTDDWKLAIEVCLRERASLAKRDRPLPMCRDDKGW